MQKQKTKKIVADLFTIVYYLYKKILVLFFYIKLNVILIKSSKITNLM